MHKQPRIDAKHVKYPSDGTGRQQHIKNNYIIRDSYIGHNNGGLLSQKMIRELEVSPKATYVPMKFPVNMASPRQANHHQKMVHYYGDGKGRDKLITVNDGGQCRVQHWREHIDVMFPALLRDYSQEYTQPDHINYLRNSKLKQLLHSQSQSQFKHSHKLSQPKFPLQRTPSNFTPDILHGGHYQSYQIPFFQTKSKQQPK